MKKAVDDENNNFINCILLPRNGTKKLGKEIGETRDSKKNGNHPDHNTKKLAVT